MTESGLIFASISITRMQNKVKLQVTKLAATETNKVVSRTRHEQNITNRGR